MASTLTGPSRRKSAEMEGEVLSWTKDRCKKHTSCRSGVRLCSSGHQPHVEPVVCGSEAPPLVTLWNTLQSVTQLLWSPQARRCQKSKQPGSLRTSLSGSRKPTPEAS